MATLYLPGASSTEVLALAAKMYATHKLSQADDHSLQCRTGGVTWIPVPQGAAANFAGLLTVDLPPNVRKGQVYTIVVRQATNATVAGGNLDVGRTQGSPTGLRASAAARTSERRVLGSFQLTIPVSTEEALLEPEELLLAIMRWIHQGIPASDRWSPVFERYLAQIADRVHGFGGDPTQTLPSPTGEGSRKHRRHEERRVYTGKIAGLIFDRFGDLALSQTSSSQMT